MLKINTSKNELWIEKDGGSFLVSPRTPTEINKLLKKHSKKKFHKGQWVDDDDNLGMIHDRVDDTIKDWRGIVDENGKQLACTRENKLIAFEYNRRLINDILDEADEIAERIRVKQEESEKN